MKGFVNYYINIMEDEFLAFISELLHPMLYFKGNIYTNERLMYLPGILKS